MGNMTVNAILAQLTEQQPYGDNPAGAEPATCVGCGCTDGHACVNEYRETCYWLKVNRETGMGVCSCCPEFLSHPCTPDFD